MNKVYQQIKSDEMVKAFLLEFLGNVKYALGFASFKYKFTISVMFALLTSPFAWLLSFLNVYVFPTGEFYKIIIFLCFADAFTGVWKALKLKRFNPLLLLIGLSTKLIVSYMAMQCFHVICSIDDFALAPDFKTGFGLTGKLIIAFYPFLSALNNFSYITDGKFPPIWWMDRMHNFEKQGGIDNLISREQNNISVPIINDNEKN